LKTAPEVLVGLATFEIPLPPESVYSIVECLGVDEVPRAAPVSPATLALLVLAHPRVQIGGEANVKPAFGIPQDINEVHCAGSPVSPSREGEPQT
jgi:hypothetical protein